MVDRRRFTARPSNSEPRPWYRIHNAADVPTTAQIDIYDEIDWLWGVSAVDFRNELKALGDGIDTIELHINSPGGDVYEAIAIMNTLRQHDARVVTTVDGLAASSAGFIAVGASDELIMAENSEIMAHLPWALVVGDAHDMRKMADDLDRIGTNIASIFATRTGGSIEDWMAVLTEETWWSAQEAVDAKIADRVLSGPKRDTAKNRFDLSIFAHAGRSHAPAPRIPQAHTETPQPEPRDEADRKEPSVASLSESALQKLGLDADADQSAIDTAIDALTQRAETPAPEPAEPTLEQATQIAAKAGLATITTEALDALQAEARAGAEARAQQVREADERIVDQAITDGKISPARRDHHLQALAADREGHTAVLNALQPGLVPLAETGHGVTAEITNEDDAVYAALFGKAN